jgi:hypothetical protein
MIAVPCIAASAAVTMPTYTEPAISALSSGRWVKFRVDTDGVYQITADELRALGFDKPENVRVYGYQPTALMLQTPSLIPADLPQVASTYSHGKLLFFAKGTVDIELPAKNNGYRRWRNPSTAVGTYFLSETADNSVLSTISAPDDAASKVETSRSKHIAIIFREDEDENEVEGGAWFNAKEITSNSPWTFKFTITNPADNTITLHTFGAVKATTSSTLTVGVTDANGNDVTLTGVQTTGATAITSSSNTKYAFFPYNNIHTFTSADNGGDYTLTATLPSANSSYAAMDHCAVLYNQTNSVANMSQNVMRFKSIGSDETFVITDVASGSDWQAWDVSNPLNVTACSLANVGDGEYLGSVGSTADSRAMARPFSSSNSTATADCATIVAFDAAANQPSPSSFEVVDNQNLHQMETPDMVIVTTPLMSSAAEELAQIHRDLQGVDVAVVNQTEIFNEFSSGNVSAVAVRRFLRYLNQKTPGKLKAVLLYGPATLKQASLINDDNFYVITCENEDIFYSDLSSSTMANQITTAFGSDSYFGFIGDATSTSTIYNNPFLMSAFNGEMVIGVGRVPASSIANAQAYNNKVREHIANPPTDTRVNNTLLLADYASRTVDSHMANAENAMGKIMQQAWGDRMTINRGELNLYSGIGTSTNYSDIKTQINTFIKENLTRGVTHMAYFGHGSNQEIGSVLILLNMNEADGITHTGRYPFIFFGTCHGVAMDLTLKGLYTELCFNPHGGCIAMIGSNREVYQNYNEQTGKAYANALTASTVKDGEYIGTIWATATTDFMATNFKDNKGRTYNHLCYNLMGDPMVPVYKVSPDYSANIGSINGTTPSSDETVTPTYELYIDGQNSIKGTIVNSAGNIDKTFNGTIKLSIYDEPYVVENQAPAITTSGVTENTTSATVKEQTLDQLLLGEYTGTVSNGQFIVNFIAPSTIRAASSNLHRISLLAYNNDATLRVGGSINGVQMTYDATKAAATTSHDAPEITSLYVDTPETTNDMLRNSSIRMHTEFTAPAGLNSGAEFGAAVKVQLDGKPCLRAANGINALGNGKYELNYAFNSLSNGVHTVEIGVTDLDGQSTVASTTFRTLIVDSAAITATFNDAKTTLTLTTDQADENTSIKYIVEDILGNAVKVINCSNPQKATWNFADENIAAGLYRVYAIIQSSNNYKSTPKTEVIID